MSLLAFLFLCGLLAQLQIIVWATYSALARLVRVRLIFLHAYLR